MTSQRQLLTVDDLLALPDDGKRYELFEGELIEMPSSSQINAILAAYIAHLLWTFVLPERLGFVTSADGGYQIDARNYFLPDVGFVTKEHAGELTGVTFPTAPDLAVEIISPSETARSVTDKTRAYLKAGTHVVWTVYPQDKIVDVYRLAEDGGLHVQTLTIGATLDGGEVLPGFTLKLADLFAVLD